MNTGLYIGTSGWYYTEWVGNFYPAGAKPGSFLKTYMTVFGTVELNNPFYRLPALETFRKWRSQAPAGFIYAVKASRFITHIKRLKDPEQSMAKFLDAVQGLGDRLGPVLFQLPAALHYDLVRLEDFLRVLPQGLRCTVEFRHDSWFRADVYELLRKYNTAFCVTQISGLNSPVICTADFAYVRLHGPGREPYAGSYSEAQLQVWKSHVMDWKAQGRQVYFYFDNTKEGGAHRNALRFITICAG